MTHGNYLQLMRVNFDLMKINLLKLSILYINQSINLLINPYFYD